MRDFKLYKQRDKAIIEAVKKSADERSKLLETLKSVAKRRYELASERAEYLDEIKAGGEQVYKCTECGREFDTERGLGVHKYRTHGES